MRHEFAVRFERDVAETLDSAVALLPGRPLHEQLAAQLCAELDENPELRGTYTVAETITDEYQEVHTVHFLHNDLDDEVMARINFRQILQNTYDLYGMSGSFHIFPMIGSMQ